MAEAAAAMSSIVELQLALQTINTLLQPTAYRYPRNCTLTNSSNFDFIVVGGGTSGSVIASRLSENSSINVLLIEAGGYPPLESEYSGWFTSLPSSNYDYNITSVNDNRTAQNVKDKVIWLTLAKMLGGGSSLSHRIYVEGNSFDYDQWANLVGDDSWNPTNVQINYKKLEKLTDPVILKTSYADLHGTNGMVKITRETSLTTKGLLDAFEELGHKILLDITATNSTLGYQQPLLAIDDGERQSSAYCYLSPAKSRCNLCVALSTTATKILIENGTAVGVQVVTSNNDTMFLYANKEVVVTAGAINSPKLLMLSGIGPKSHLEDLGIDVIADLPVGENFQYHVSSVIGISMSQDDDTGNRCTISATNPHNFPVPMTTGYVALSPLQNNPDYQVITLTFPEYSSAMLQLCVNSFKYSFELCQKFYEGTYGKSLLYSIISLMQPKSRGKVLLASKDPADPPRVYTGTYSNSSDLTMMGKSLAHFNKVLNTTYFNSVNATLVDTGLCSNITNDTEYWECYAIAISNTMWHYIGTCSMGLVLDSSFRVKGINGLRVMDASSIPSQISGNIEAAVMMAAERGAELILKSLNISSPNLTEPSS